jgi:predicted lipoprotein with Yx(FWY)xxD motif
MRTGVRRGALAAALSLALVGLAACGSSSSGASGGGSSSTAATPSGGGTTSSTASTVPGGTVDGTFPPDTATITSSSSALGPILVDGTGHTLYAYLPDAAGGVPTCLAACAKVWPAVTGTFLGVGNAVPVQPHEFKLVPIPGATTRQVVVNGHPLYRFSGDGLAGDLKGQGIDHQWYVVGTDGQLITKAVPTTTTASG